MSVLAVNRDVGLRGVRFPQGPLEINQQGMLDDCFMACPIGSQMGSARPELRNLCTGEMGVIVPESTAALELYTQQEDAPRGRLWQTNSATLECPIRWSDLGPFATNNGLDDPWSLSIWTRPHTFAQYASYGGLGVLTDEYGFTIGPGGTNNLFRCSAYDPGTFNEAFAEWSSFPTAPYGNSLVYHILVRWPGNGGTFEIFFNGVSRGTDTNTTGYNADTLDTFALCGGYTNTFTTDGQAPIYDGQAWGRYLSNAEIDYLVDPRTCWNMYKTRVPRTIFLPVAAASATNVVRMSAYIH